MKDKLIYVAIVILLGIAIGLGVVIFQRYDTTTQDQSSAEQLGENAGEYSRLLPSIDIEKLGITEEEGNVLSPPSPDSLESEKEAHLALTEKLAVFAEYLDITKCEVADPVVFSVSYDSSFTVRNEDTVDHDLVRGPGEKRFTVPAGGEITLTADWGEGPGVFAYACDSIRRPVGMILMTP